MYCEYYRHNVCGAFASFACARKTHTHTIWLYISIKASDGCYWVLYALDYYDKRNWKKMKKKNGGQPMCDVGECLSGFNKCVFQREFHEVFFSGNELKKKKKNWRSMGERGVVVIVAGGIARGRVIERESKKEMKRLEGSKNDDDQAKKKQKNISENGTQTFFIVFHLFCHWRQMFKHRRQF